MGSTVYCLRVACCCVGFAIAITATANGKTIDYPELGVSITIPDGYRERPDFVMGNPDMLAAFVEAEPYRAEEHVVIWVQRMRDVIDEGWIDVFAGSQGAQLLTIPWRGTDLPLIKTPNTAGGLRRTQINVQIPMKPEAIHIGLVGPVDRDEELTALIEEIVTGVEGETNWRLDKAGIPTWVIAVIALIIGAAIGFIAARLSSKPRSEG
jgi:hypothetical protein